MAGQKVTRIIDTRYAAVSFNSHDTLLEKALATPCSDNCLSVCFIHRWITTILRRALNNRLQPSLQRCFLSQREIQLVLAKAQEPHRTWYGLAAETGLRAGELCGLTVDDIDLERGMLQVRQSAWRGKLGDPKTAESIRVVELSPQACRHLRTFLESWHPDQRRLLFATRNGTPWDQNLLLKRKFRPLLRALGIQVPRGNGFHAFRHANATLMSSFGASQKLRQQRLGHADGSPVTDTIYTHVISEDGKRIAAQLGKAVWGVLDASWTEKENGRGVESPKPFVIN